MQAALKSLAERGWEYVRLVNYRNNTRRLMRRYDAVYAPPPRRWTLNGYGVWRDHEHFFNTTVR